MSEKIVGTLLEHSLANEGRHDAKYLILSSYIKTKYSLNLIILLDPGGSFEIEDSSKLRQYETFCYNINPSRTAIEVNSYSFQSTAEFHCYIPPLIRDRAEADLVRKVALRPKRRDSFPVSSSYNLRRSVIDMHRGAGFVTLELRFDIGEPRADILVGFALFSPVLVERLACDASTTIARLLESGNSLGGVDDRVAVMALTASSFMASIIRSVTVAFSTSIVADVRVSLEDAFRGCPGVGAGKGVSHGARMAESLLLVLIDSSGGRELVSTDLVGVIFAPAILSIRRIVPLYCQPRK